MGMLVALSNAIPRAKCTLQEWSKQVYVAREDMRSHVCMGFTISLA